ncbi:LolA family protein [Leadbetterella byssophila]|uniref:LolA family protein n=1 Tax=Leadbetterella byssophila TaxID=316068 RepID=UPI00399F94F2
MKWLIVSFFLFFSQEMSDAEIREFKAGIKKFTAQTETLSADFIQYRHSTYLAKPAESRGKLYFSKPNTVLWKYQSPQVVDVLFKDKKMSVKENGKSKEAGKRWEKLQNFITQSSTGELFESKEFKYKFLKGGKVILTTVDPQLKRYISQIDLQFDEYALSEIKMVEPKGDYTLIQMKNKQINKKLDAQVFNL